MAEATHKIIVEDCKHSCLDTGFFSNLNNQTVLITGGTGFIGKWLCEMIAYVCETEGYNINLYLLSRDSQRFKIETPHLAQKPYTRLIEQDVKNVHDLPKDINYIIHAAGSPDNRDHVSQPIKTVETFYKGTQAILDAAVRLPELKKIIHISSHQVYGISDATNLMNEKYTGKIDLSGVNSIYGESKRIAETLCSIYRSQFKLPIVVIRPFALIGPYQDLEKPWAINNFIRDAMLGGPIRIIGNGSTVRAYLYASDMAYWILKALVIGQSGESYNLGSNVAISLNELANKVKETIDSGVEILSKSSKENYDNVSKIVPDTAKIMAHLGVEETYSVNDALKRTVLWNQLCRSENK